MQNRLENKSTQPTNIFMLKKTTLYTKIIFLLVIPLKKTRKKPALDNYCIFEIIISIFVWLDAQLFTKVYRNRISIILMVRKLQ